MLKLLFCERSGPLKVRLPPRALRWKIQTNKSFTPRSLRETQLKIFLIFQP
jgi:hypothetical protein